MKRRGVVKGKTIELDTPIGLTEGQRVEMDIQVIDEATGPFRENKGNFRRKFPPTEELAARIATEPQFESIREANRIRSSLEKHWGGKLNRSLEYIREDRNR